MTDIVERLRRANPWTGPAEASLDRAAQATAELVIQAADEIERLRAENAKLLKELIAGHDLLAEQWVESDPHPFRER